METRIGTACSTAIDAGCWGTAQAPQDGSIFLIFSRPSQPLEYPTCNPPCWGRSSHHSMGWDRSNLQRRSQQSPRRSACLHRLPPPTPTQQPAASVPFPEGGPAVGWRTPLKPKETRHWGGMSRVSPAIDETRSSPGSAVRLMHKTELREPRQIGQATQDPTGTDTAR